MTFPPILKTVTKIFLGILVFIGVVVALLLAGVSLINLKDEPLTPEASAMLAYRQQELPDAGNGYVMMLGFTAPAGSDWKKVAAERIARHNEQVRGKVAVAMEANTRQLGFSECAGCEKIFRRFNDNNEAKYLAWLRSLPQQEAQINQLLADNAELIRRYEGMQSASAFSETMLISFPVFPFPDYSDIGSTQRLLLARALLAAFSGDREALLDFLERDISFWRLVMQSETTLITSMTAHGYLARELRLLRMLLPQIDFSASELERLRHLLTPLSLEELRLLRHLEREWYATAEFFLHFAGKSDRPTFVAKLLFSSPYKPQATVNLYAEKMRPWKELASMSAPEFAARHAMPPMEENTEEDLVEELYNFLGRFLVAESEPDYAEYIARRHDLAASMQLTRAQLELRLAGIDAGENPDAVPEFLAQANPETLNPYTGKPFAWDKTCRRLSFTPQAERHHYAEVTLAEIPEENAALCAVSAVSTNAAVTD